MVSFCGVICFRHGIRACAPCKACMCAAIATLLVATAPAVPLSSPASSRQRPLRRTGANLLNAVRVLCGCTKVSQCGASVWIYGCVCKLACLCWRFLFRRCGHWLGDGQAMVVQRSGSGRLDPLDVFKELRHACHPKGVVDYDWKQQQPAPSQSSAVHGSCEQKPQVASGVRKTLRK